MQRTSPSVEGRPPRWRGPGAAWWAVAAVIAIIGILWLAWPDPAGNHGADARVAPGGGRSSGITPGWLLSGVFAAFAVGWLAAAALARLQRNSLQRDARAESMALHQVLDTWHWQTDAQHRLVRWQPPSHAPASAWAGRSAGQALWERFDGDPAQALRARMETTMPITDVDLTGIPGANGSPAARWRLRGVPRLGRDGDFAGYLGTARPLDAEQALARERKSLHTVLDTLATPAFVFDVRDGIPTALRHANADALALLTLDAARHATDGSFDAEAVAAALPEGLGFAVRETLAGRAAEHGEWRLECRRCGEADAAGEAPLLLMLCTRAATPATQAATADAGDVESEHRAFSYTVSHDLRAPIRVVEGFARILKEDYGGALDRIGNDHLDRVLGAAARMNSMIDSMLALAQLSSQPLARQPVNLTQMAGYVIDDLRREQPQRRVNVRVQPGMTTHGDPTLLRMALENLLGNAWKYSGKRDEAEIRFETERRDGREVYVIADNGAGFDMRFADRLFGAFQRLHSANDFAGTGVGLASVRRIVRRHGGDIWAESEVGHGARFYFTLRPEGTADAARAERG